MSGLARQDNRHQLERRLAMETGNEQIGTESISIYSAVAGKVVVSANEAIQRLQVFTPMDRLVRTLTPMVPTYTFNLPAGIYIIRTEIVNGQQTVKLRVK